MPEQLYDLYLCGWRVRSELQLPELAAWTGETTHTVDIDIRIGEVAEFENILPLPRGLQRKRLWIGAEGECRLDVIGVCSLSMRGGQEIIMKPDVSCDLLTLRGVLLGHGIAMLCHQRRLLPFHGSCLRLGDAAVIFSGDSGAGKSTIAAALTQKGHTLLSDDLCVLEEKDNGWVVHPAFPRIKVDGYSLDTLGDLGSSIALNSMEGKHHIYLNHAQCFESTPVPLKAIYFLQPLVDTDGTSGNTPVQIIEVAGFARLLALENQVMAWSVAKALGRSVSIRADIIQLATSVKIRTLLRRLDFSLLDQTIRMLERQHDAA